MLNSVAAVQFIKRIGSGKTKPCLLSCFLESGEEIEVIAKFSAGCERGVGGLVAEAIAAMLAVDLDLPIPEPTLVEIDPDFVGTIPDMEDADRMRASVSVAFGSKKLPPGFSLVPKDKAIPRALAVQAVEIFAFDALIQNPDRRPENPNCLSDGRNFAIFDHELAFMTKGIVGWKPPWKVGGLSFFSHSGAHIFYNELKGKALNFDRLAGAWEAVSDARLQKYEKALPLVWANDGGVAQAALTYVAQVRNNIGSALAEVTRILQ